MDLTSDWATGIGSLSRSVNTAGNARLFVLFKGMSEGELQATSA